MTAKECHEQCQVCLSIPVRSTHVLNAFKYNGVIIKIREYNDYERLFFLFGIPFRNLFRFFYYKWVHHTTDVTFDFSLSDVKLPHRVIDLCNKIEEYLPQVSNNTYILDPNILYNSLVDIQYYYRRKLIRNDEISDIKGELKAMIDMTEKIIRKGMYMNTGSTFDYYISLLPIESNSVYTNSVGHTISYFYPYSVNPMIIRNTEICSVHKRWLESLKKYSILITQSNEELYRNFLVISLSMSTIWTSLCID